MLFTSLEHIHCPVRILIIIPLAITVKANEYMGGDKVTKKLPFLLAGPIVRRVEPSRAYIWIATSNKCVIKPVFYNLTPGKNSEYNYHPIKTYSEPMYIPLGKRLYIYLIKITPQSGSFPTNTLIGYNLHFETRKTRNDFESLGILSSLVYGNLKYPSFQIKEGKEQSRIFYGSCRKLAGKESDALAIADEKMESQHANPEKRPDALFLMGDQIYADDVAHPAALALYAIGRELMGISEPLGKIDPRFTHYQDLSRKINGRQKLMEQLCSFTSDHQHNHLLELGEYAAMYLLSWSPALWETARSRGYFKSFEEANRKGFVHFKSHDEAESLKKEFYEQADDLILFEKALFQVSRLLANIPVYMIFDDHDITDDWNLSREWKENVYKSPLGRHAIANGLTAYWAFQGWGNDPDSFGNHFIEAVSLYASALQKGKGGASYGEWLDTMCNFSSWQFVAPVWPKALFLDTRTQREFPKEDKTIGIPLFSKAKIKGPELMSREAWKTTLLKLKKSGWVSGSPMVIISATPVYGIGLIESFLLKLAPQIRAVGIDARTSLDYEAWKYNGTGFTEFLNQLADLKPKQCIILSGDLHSASAVHSLVTFADGRTLSIQQCTSSPLKNMSFTGVWGQLMKEAIDLNAAKRKDREINRICTTDYEILEDEKDENSYLWKDTLKYQYLNKHSIVEIHNNLGMIDLTSREAKNLIIPVK